MIRRRSHRVWALLLSVTVASGGCHPTQPFHFFDDGDLSHYLDVATEIEFPDLDQAPFHEAIATEAPLTLDNPDPREFWELSLEDAIQITLANSLVMRKLGAIVSTPAPDVLTRQKINSASLTTVYDPAIVESGYGGATGSVLGGIGTESALAEFDARLSTSVIWEKNNRPQNVTGVVESELYARDFIQDLGQFNAGITKTTAAGTTFSFSNDTIYDANNNPSRQLWSDWTTNFAASFTQPLLQGAGTQYNRIAGPQNFDAYNAGFTNSIDGVVIARIRTDITLADFEGGVRDVVKGTEDAYWDLYFAFRNLQTRKVGRDSALETWSTVHAKTLEGVTGGEADKEAQARSQYFFFRAEAEAALNEVLRAENRLRYAMGLAVADGRLIRPLDDPTMAQVRFDWQEIVVEAICRRVEIRKQKWEVKKRELELVAARNHLLPRLDAVGRYSWNGLGNDLIGPRRAQDPNLLFLTPGSTAFQNLMDGNFQEWQLGLQLSVPIGFRNQLAEVRHHQLLLARERSILNNLELEVSHQLGDAVRDLDSQYHLTQSNFNRASSAEDEVTAVNTAYDAGTVTLDLLLDAQRRRADAEAAYYRSLVEYNKAISLVHSRKGSLLDYDDVYLAEGPWPGKAYFDALRQARKRDASMYLNYGFTMPRVFSRGIYNQQGGSSQPIDGNAPTEVVPEEIGMPPSTQKRDEQPRKEKLPAPSVNTRSAARIGVTVGLGRVPPRRDGESPPLTQERDEQPRKEKLPTPAVDTPSAFRIGRTVGPGRVHPIRPRESLPAVDRGDRPTIDVKAPTFPGAGVRRKTKAQSQKPASF